MVARAAFALPAALGLALCARGCGDPRRSPSPGAASAAPSSSAADLAAPSAIPGASASAPAAGASAGALSPEDEIVVRPREIADLLQNPGMGFETFQRFDGQPLNPGVTWTEEGPIDPPADAPSRADFPASSIAYFRWFWSRIEPSPGAYQWSIVDRALAAARAHRQTLAVRFMPWDDAHPAPAWLPGTGVKRAPGDEGPTWHPDADDPLYERRWGALVSAAAARYDGHPGIEAIDIAGSGPWGSGGGPFPPSFPRRQALLDDWFDAFKQTSLLVNFDEGKGLSYAASRGAGMRLDCFGDLRLSTDGVTGWSHMRDLYPQGIVRAGVKDLWQTRPVHLESCWVPAYWQKRGWDVAAILDQALRWHVSVLNVKSTAIPAEWKSAFEDLERRMGYRLVLKQISWPRSARAGSMIPVHMLWRNTGVAPPYRPWVPAIQLFSPEGSAVVRLPVDVRKWLPDDSVFDGSIHVPDKIAPKKYRVRVALLDPESGEPRVQLAIEGKKPDGWYELGWITVRE
jgi:Domain of unknown function (DUF4832)